MSVPSSVTGPDRTASIDQTRRTGNRGGDNGDEFGDALSAELSRPDRGNDDAAARNSELTRANDANRAAADRAALDRAAATEKRAATDRATQNANSDRAAANRAADQAAARRADTKRAADSDAAADRAAADRAADRQNSVDEVRSDEQQDRIEKDQAELDRADSDEADGGKVDENEAAEGPDTHVRDAHKAEDKTGETRTEHDSKPDGKGEPAKATTTAKKAAPKQAPAKAAPGKADPQVDQAKVAPNPAPPGVGAPLPGLAQPVPAEVAAATGKAAPAKAAGTGVDAVAGHQSAEGIGGKKAPDPKLATGTKPAVQPNADDPGKALAGTKESWEWNPVRANLTATQAAQLAKVAGTPAGKAAAPAQPPVLTPPAIGRPVVDKKADDVKAAPGPANAPAAPPLPQTGAALQSNLTGGGNQPGQGQPPRPEPLKATEAAAPAIQDKQPARTDAPPAAVAPAPTFDPGVPPDAASAAAGVLNQAITGPQAAAPAAPTAPVAPPTPTPSQMLNTPAMQLAVRITPLRLDADGIHRLTVHLHPMDLGPVQVVAEVRNGDINVQLTSSTDAGNDALRDALNDLRRELQDSGFGNTTLDLRQGNPQQESGQQQFGGGGGQPSWGGRETTTAAPLTPEPVSTGRRVDPGNGRLDTTA